MKKIILPLLVILCIALSPAAVKAQAYQTAIGAKIYAKSGTLGGFNIKQSLDVNQAVEGSLLFGSGIVALEGLYDLQGDIPGVEGLRYLAGGGGILGFSTSKNTKTNFGLRLTGGAEYIIPDVPFAVSLSIDPFFTLVPHTHANVALGIGLRYVIK